MKAAATVLVPVQPGEILAGRYVVDRVIGSGGMGVVVAARHAELGHLVAIKLLLPELVDRPEIVERFLREARAVVQLKSEHAVRVLDVGLHEPRGAHAGRPQVPYMVMEYLDGVSLFGLLARGPIAVPDAADQIAQACEALEEAHRIGIVHRDLKPDNLFVTRRPNGAALVKVLDFGISLVPEGEGASRLTGQADVMGTPLYMSPEQMMSARNADARSDVWALGATLYELLTGRAAFAGANVTEICTRVLSSVPASPSALRAEIPAELSAVVMRCLEKAPERRFPSAGELGRALSPFRPGGAAWGRPRPPAPSPDEPTNLYTPLVRSPRLSDPGADALPPAPTPGVLAVAPAATGGVTTGIDARRASLRWGLWSFGAGDGGHRLCGVDPRARAPRRSSVPRIREPERRSAGRRANCVERERAGGSRDCRSRGDCRGLLERRADRRRARARGSGLGRPAPAARDRACLRRLQQAWIYTDPVCSVRSFTPHLLDVRGQAAGLGLGQAALEPLQRPPMSSAATRDPLGDGVPTLRPPLGDGAPTLGGGRISGTGTGTGTGAKTGHHPTLRAPYGVGARRAVRSRRALLLGYVLFLIASPALADSPSRPASSASVSASPASSDSASALAEALFQEALRLAKAGKFQEACPKFAASHKASRSYGAAFNLGACDEELGKTASAWAAFSEAVPLARDGGERADAEERVKALSPRLVRRKITPPGSEPGLTITWDGAPLDRAAWDVAVPIDPGAHEITASAPGKRPWTKKIDATKEGETVTLQVPPLVAVAAISWPLQRTLGLATGGLGVAGVVVGSVLGGLASSRWNEAKPLCYPDHTCDPPGASMAAEARTLAHGSTASFIAGGALVATGVVLFFTSGAKSAPGPAAKARVTPWIGPDGAGSAVTVSF